MTLQFAFANGILYKNSDCIRLRRLKLLKNSWRAFIAKVLCIKVWTRVLTLILLCFFLTISIFLVKICFKIFLYKLAIFELIYVIIFKFIFEHKKTAERSISGWKIFLEWVLFLNFCK